MVKSRVFYFFCFLIGLGLAVLACGVDQARAQSSKDVQSQAVQSTLQSTQKSGHQRRQEAKKRLQEAIEARKAERLAAPDKAAPDKYAKGVQNE
ncbi:MAG TPA: hypothetical protein VGJ93_06995 [Desulfuromonadaceae bacterium]|jgi:Flp pilus assembly protein TadB